VTNQFFENNLCSRHQGFSSLMMPTEMVLETSIQCPFNHLTRFLARESFTEWKCSSIRGV